MPVNKNNYNFLMNKNLVFVITLYLLLILGGLGNIEIAFLVFYISLALILVFRKIFKFRYQHFPPSFFLFLLFLLLQLISLSWSKNLIKSAFFISFFISGLCFWLLFYNNKIKFFRLNSVIIFLGIIFGILTILVTSIPSLTEIKPFSLYQFSVLPRHHHHIGDLWALVLIVISLKYIQKQKRLWLLLFPLGYYLLFLSLSRSAYVSLALGSLFCVLKIENVNKRKIFWLNILVCVALFIYAGTQKSTILAHAGFLGQGILGTLHNPFGVGMGNFDIISENLEYSIWGLTGGSSSAHNIVMEVFSGMGIFGLSFIVWLVMVFKNIYPRGQSFYNSVQENHGFQPVDELNSDMSSSLRKPRPLGRGGRHSNYNLTNQAVFLALTVNFMFDFTYLIPTMFWLWFACLGLIQAELSEKLSENNQKGFN